MLGRLLLPACTLALPTTLTFAQAVAPEVLDAAVLAKYDTNKDGVLDSAEQAKREADRVDAVKKPVEKTEQFMSEEPIEMSVFEVNEQRTGYYASSTQAGTRINSTVEDIPASVTVVTLDQMDDFAMLDLNDIFTYEAGTEGMGTYTDFSVNNSGNPIDGNMADPTSANRIRGMGSANISLGNFETSGRVPVDRIGIEGVEISRGPSSTIFGLGNPSGTVNMVAATGNLNKNKNQAQVRFDSIGGFREHLDVNRVLIKNKLAFRFSQVYQDTKYRLKPSGTDTERYNFMLKYQPFKKTTLSASYQYYELKGNRPNSVTPRDGITPWLGRGSPTWDPLTARVYVDDQIVSSSMSAYGFVTGWQNSGRGSSLIFVDPSGVNYWAAPRGTSSDNPLTPNQAAYNYVILNPQTNRLTQPLFTSDGAVSDKALYDWSSINVASGNYVVDKTDTFLVQATQTVIETPKQMLALQLGWFREDSSRFQNLLSGRPNSSGPTGGFLAVDVNRRRLDGTANPNYLRPYIAISDAYASDSPLLNDTYRAQIAYKLDFSRDKGLSRWLGVHQAVPYFEYKEFMRQNFNYRYAMIDNHTWLPSGTPRGTTNSQYGTDPYNLASSTGTRNYNFYYVGDANGTNVDYAPGAVSPGIYNYAWGNAVTGVFNYEPTQLGLAGSLDGTGGRANLLKEQKTAGVVLQSHWLKGRLVTTLGLREDRLSNTYGVVPRLMPDALNHDFQWDDQWAQPIETRGTTETIGAVWKALSWLNIYGNKSDSFLPADPAIDLHGQNLPNPTGKGKDWGILLKFFDNKFTLRVNRYENEQLNSRSGVSATIARAAARLDIWDDQAQSRNFALTNQASQWIQAAAGGMLPPDQLFTQTAQLMQLDEQRIRSLIDSSDVLLAETEDVQARGTEIELNYEPVWYWRMKANVTQQESVQGNLSPALLSYIEERLPVWQSLIDTRTGANWWTSQYNGVNSTTPSAFYLGTVAAPLRLALSKEGKTLPQIRKYSVKYSTNFQLAGITENKILKGFNISASARWADKAAIGYYGIPDAGGIYRDLDGNRPVYDKARFYADIGIGYKTKISKRIRANFQINVSNIQEDSTRLQPVSAFPDGTPSAYRIIDPRLFIFTSTFDF
ncbi:TonB-dependent receptor [Nibricoccus aquaticus]|uniref:TonB-dependent receptor n=1 Tax=Nibricoccus aquaticus TaxID=2576891 RepID=A0A290QBA5_9BACT|nr:TonB-dependent receptor [Nibricoccus aquaticus]